MTSARNLRGLLGGAAAALLVLAALPAAAQQQGQTWEDSFYPFARVGPYFGLGAQFALENFDLDPPIEDAADPTNLGADDGGGLFLRGGYRLHPRIAAELMFQYYWGFQVKGRSGAGNNVDDEFNAWTLTANAKLYPFLGRFQPYAVAGFGALVFDKKNNGDDAGFVSRMGGGLDVYVTDNVIVAFETVYLFPGGDISEFQFATFGLGLQYRY